MNDPNMCQPVRLMTDDEVDRMVEARSRDYFTFDRFIWLANGCQTVCEGRREFLLNAWMQAHREAAAR